jgi:tripartite-type tricarboxylate transporter receptor subunit TctC
LLRRRIVSLGLAAAAAASGLVVSTRASAQEFPVKPVTLLVAFPAGGAGDVVMRAMADVAGKKLGQPVVVDNRVGASGTAAPATMAATAKPDGYTISQTVLPLVRVALMQKVTYDPARDFTYIANLTAYTFGIVSKSGGPFRTWADVVKFAKDNPGKVTYASPGVGTSLHVGMEELSAREQIKVTHVPMKGAGESSAAVLGDHVMLQVDATNWKPLVEAGKLQPLMVWSQTRLKSLPDVPTLSELVPAVKEGGEIPAMFESPFGISGPKGMPAPVVKKLQDAFEAATKDETVLATLARYDMNAKFMTSEQYTKFMLDAIKVEKQTLDRVGLSKKE